MKKHVQNYLDSLHERPTHERRRISARLAAGVIAGVFVIWLSTLGVRLANTNTDTQNVAQNDGASLVAATAASDGGTQNDVMQTQNSLETTATDQQVFTPDYTDGMDASAAADSSTTDYTATQ